MDRCGREALLSLCGSPDFDFSKFSRFLAMVAQLSSHPWSRKGSSAEKLRSLSGVASFFKEYDYLSIDVHSTICLLVGFQYRAQLVYIPQAQRLKAYPAKMDELAPVRLQPYGHSTAC
ncbi:unnamed protein product [Urochloa humidicola]